MKIKTETRVVNISLNLWRAGWNAGYEPDCFDDMEINFPMDNPGREYGDYAILATDEAANNLIDWWESEVESANHGEDGDGLCGLSKSEIENGGEWVLTVEESE